VSVINACRDLEASGATVVAIAVDGEGRTDPAAVERALTVDTTLVSVSAASGRMDSFAFAASARTMASLPMMRSAAPPVRSRASARLSS